MGWLRFGFADERPADAAAAAEVHDATGRRLGVPAAWEPDAKPRQCRVKIDARAVDPGGLDGWASVALARRGVWLPFDDPAVTRALRAVLAGPPADVVSTLVVGDSRFVGAVTAVRDEPGRLADDPFARLLPTRLLRLGPGLLGRTPWPVGPVTQRDGSGNPWPADRFEPAP